MLCCLFFRSSVALFKMMYAAFPESGFYDFGGIPPPEQAYMTAPTMMASGLSMVLWPTSNVLLCCRLCLIHTVKLLLVACGITL